MFYIRTADRLQRTSTWFNNLEGGIDYLKQVIIEDSLGICAELEAEMQHVVGTYQDEWKSAIEDEQKLKQFRHFINSDEADHNVVFVPERDQIRPATREEKSRFTLGGFVPLASIGGLATQEKELVEA
jgi:nitrite reductase (NADH) large subunit